MLTSFVFFTSDGAIFQTGQCSDTMIDVTRDTLAAAGLPGIPDARMMQIAELPDSTDGMTLRWYVDNGVLRSRVPIDAVVSTTSIAANGVDEADISGLPTPSCFCTITGAVTVPVFEITDGTLALTSNVAGDILVSVTAPPPWLAWSTTVRAT